MGDEVRKVSREAEELHRHCALIGALMGGTAAMRGAGKAFLPQWPGEPDASYRARLATAVLFPAYRRTVSVLVGKPFSKPITVGDKVPPQVAELLPDVDCESRTLDQFAAEIAMKVMAQGFAGILVDMPVNPGARTVAEERAAGMRPYFIHVDAEDVLGWKAVKRGSQMQLSQLRLLECVDEDDGEFGVAEVEQVRVLEPGRWRVFRENQARRGEWDLHAEGITSIDVIPFVPVYGFRHEFMVGEPPMLDLAYMNVEHWQSASDQQTILHVARVPILFGKGFADGENIVVGANSFVAAQNPDADLRYVEHSGAAIDAGHRAIQAIEDRMRQAGAELLVIKPGNVTVAQTVADSEQGKCDLQRIVQGMEASLDQALDLMCRWMGLPEGCHVDIWDDFGAATLEAASADLLASMEHQGSLSLETMLSEFKRRGVLAPEVDVEEEMSRIASERAKRAAANPGGNGGQPLNNADPAAAGGAPGGTAR